VAEQTLSELTHLYPEKVRVIFQHFPLEGHRWSGLAHQAAECAARQKKFWPYHDRLYTEQAAWSVLTAAPLESFLRYAKEAGMDLDLFSRCLSDNDIQQRIRQEKATGTGMGVRSTPSFFVNGKMVVGSQTLKQEVEKALQ
jgi:protein-disulfide isomerase